MHSDDAEALGREIDAIAAEVRFSGVVRVDRADQPPVARAYGLANRAYGVPNTVDTQFGVASGSKGFTALVAMKLIERGELGLDTPVRSVLGTDLPLIDDRVTVEQLIGHRSGIGDYLDEDELDDNNDYVLEVPVHQLVTIEDFLVVLDGNPMKHEPDETFNYCNGGYMVLALVAERVSGVPYHDLVDQWVCQPAGMVDTAFLRTDELPARAALNYLHDDGLRTNVFHLPVRANGDGGAYSTVADMHRFWEALVAGVIVSPDTVAIMTNPRSEMPGESTRGGLGFFIDGSTGAIELHGFDAGVGFMSICDRARRLTYTVICNQTRGAWPTYEALRTLLAAEN